MFAAMKVTGDPRMEARIEIGRAGALPTRPRDNVMAAAIRAAVVGQHRLRMRGSGDRDREKERAQQHEECGGSQDIDRALDAVLADAWRQAAGVEYSDAA